MSHGFVELSEEKLKHAVEAVGEDGLVDDGAEDEGDQDLPQLDAEQSQRQQDGLVGEGDEGGIEEHAGIKELGAVFHKVSGLGTSVNSGKIITCFGLPSASFSILVESFAASVLSARISNFMRSTISRFNASRLVSL